MKNIEKLENILGKITDYIETNFRNQIQVVNTRDLSINRYSSNIKIKIHGTEDMIEMYRKTDGTLYFTFNSLSAVKVLLTTWNDVKEAIKKDNEIFDNDVEEVKNLIEHFEV